MKNLNLLKYATIVIFVLISIVFVYNYVFYQKNKKQSYVEISQNDLSNVNTNTDELARRLGINGDGEFRTGGQMLEILYSVFQKYKDGYVMKWAPGDGGEYAYIVGHSEFNQDGTHTESWIDPDGKPWKEYTTKDIPKNSESTEIIYMTPNNIWNLPPINKYNFK